MMGSVPALFGVTTAEGVNPTSLNEGNSYQFERKILLVRTQEKAVFPETKQRALSNVLHTVVTYASAVSKCLTSRSAHVSQPAPSVIVPQHTSTDIPTAPSSPSSSIVRNGDFSDFWCWGIRWTPATETPS